MFFEAFPKELYNDLQVVLKIIPKDTYNNVSIGCSEEFIRYNLNNIKIHIPYRMYFVDVSPERVNSLSKTQKEIFYCIYTRSCNGYVREKYLNELLHLNFSSWSIPFIVKLCDEYIIEILELLYDKLKERNNTDIQSFCLDNKSTIHKSYNRMISYWNAFYRENEKSFHRYVGRKLFRECLGYNGSLYK